MATVPEVSVVISAWQAAGTIRACLESLAVQTMREFEVQLVDGGPDHAVEAAAAQYPFVRYTRIDAFCTMHRKRNLGVGKSRSALVVFSDPDVVADEAWLEKLVACWRQHQRPIAGAIACFGNRLTDRIVHLIKFDYWLVRGETRSIDAGATANMLVSREQYDAVGGFDETTYLGDLKLSRDLSAAGYPLIFCPEAVVEHDHERVSLLKTVREHWRRGREFQQMETTRQGPGDFVRHSALLLPRLIKRSCRTVLLGLRAGELRAALLGAPFVAAAHAAWLGGESRAVWGRMTGSADFTRSPDST